VKPTDAQVVELMERIMATRLTNGDASRLEAELRRMLNSRKERRRAADGEPKG